MTTTLESNTQIEPQDWMTDPDTKKVMSALNSTDPALKKAMFVGGCVRNAILGHYVEDIDIATKLRPERVITVLDRFDIKTIPTGIEHGTVTAICGSGSFEITTLRKDVNTDGRHAQVVFTDDWVLDAKRRDFTMNTLLADDQGHIFDPLKCGMEDLKQKRVVFVGDPLERIREDYLRILRFFRFHAYYGAGNLDEAALAACRAEAEGIDRLSKERITMEFMKILKARHPAYVLKNMQENNILSDVFHPSFDVVEFSSLCKMQQEYNLWEPISRLTLICGFSEEHIETVQNRLILSKTQKKALIDTSRAYYEVGDNAENIKKLIYRYGRDSAARAVLCAAAVNGDDPSTYMEMAQNFEPPVFPIDGNDVRTYAGDVLIGPQIGETLKKIELWWLDQGMMPTRDECIQYMQDKLIH